MKVSVVMAAKNYDRFLPMAVRSVQAQTFTDWELVIIDDGSTDGTRTAVKAFLNDPRIRYVQSDRLGQSRAKNLGVRLSRGEFIAFLDADDAWRPTKLEKQITAMTDNIGVMACEREIIGEDILEEPRTSVSATSPRSLTFAALQCISRDAIFVSNPICFSSVLVRKHVFDRVGGFDADLDLSIDYDLWLRVAAHFKIVSLPEKLVLYRTGHGNLSKKQADRIATAFTIMNRRRDGISRDALAAGYGSTCQSLAWLYRGGERWNALRWYAKSVAWGQRLSAFKGMAGTLLRPLPAMLTADNRSINY